MLLKQDDKNEPYLLVSYVRDLLITVCHQIGTYTLSIPINPSSAESLTLEDNVVYRAHNIWDRMVMESNQQHHAPLMSRTVKRIFLKKYTVIQAPLLLQVGLLILVLTLVDKMLPTTADRFLINEPCRVEDTGVRVYHICSGPCFQRTGTAVLYSARIT